jgi:hypothetical protein
MEDLLAEVKTLGERILQLEEKQVRQPGRKPCHLKHTTVTRRGGGIACICGTESSGVGALWRSVSPALVLLEQLLELCDHHHHHHHHHHYHHPYSFAFPPERASAGNDESERADPDDEMIIPER